MAKKYYLRDLKKYDADNGASVVRQLEMEADMAITSPGYPIQFWKDVQLYGVDEAILYVKNGKHGNAEALAEKWKKIKGTLEK